MRVSKRHVFTFSVLSLVQLNSSTLNAGQISNLIERTAAGEVGNVRSAMTRKIDIQTLHQSQVQNWIEGIVQQPSLLLAIINLRRFSQCLGRSHALRLCTNWVSSWRHPIDH